jgi:hypothetical protein
MTVSIIIVAEGCPARGVTPFLVRNFHTLRGTDVMRPVVGFGLPRTLKAFGLKNVNVQGRLTVEEVSTPV